MESNSSLSCNTEVAAFVDALETINCSEAEVETINCVETEVEGTYDGKHIMICLNDAPPHTAEEISAHEAVISIRQIEEATADVGQKCFNPDTRRLKAVMQQLIIQKKATVIQKSQILQKGPKQFKSDVWHWFGDVRMFITESDAKRLKIPYYFRQHGNEQIMICKVFVGCFRCSAIFMYDAQRHSTSTLRYHVRACTRPKECIYISDDRIEPPETVLKIEDGLRKKRFRTDPRKQKEVIEQLFATQKAVVTRKSFMNIKGNRRFKSDVWNWFGDIKLLISRTEAKQLKIPYYVRRCGEEQMVLSKVFVGCFKCMALFIHDSQKSTSTLRYHIRTCSRPKDRRKRNVPNIIFFPSKCVPKEPCTVIDSEAIPDHEKLLNFVISTESSFDVMDDSEFHRVLQSCITIGALYGDVNIDSLLCGSPSLKNYILNDMYITAVNGFYTEFQHSYGVTYRPVIWIDEQVKVSFISVYCHYVSPEGKLQTVILNTDEFDYETRNFADVRDWFNQFLLEQTIIPYKRSVSIDCDSALGSALKNENCIKCSVQGLTFALQNIVGSGTTNTNSEIQEFVTLLNNCVDVTEYLEQVSDQYSIPEELTKSLDSKWSSIIELFRSIEVHYELILSILNETGATHMLSIERYALTSIVEFFKIFEECIAQLTNPEETTLNLVIPWFERLEEFCRPAGADSSAVRQLKVSLLPAVKSPSVTDQHRMATFLDPRYKKLPFQSAVGLNDIVSKLKVLVKECAESPNIEELLDFRRSHSEDSNCPGFEEKTEKHVLEEVDNYLSSTHLEIKPDLRSTSDFSLLKYWLEMSEFYPYLSKIAMWILSCPACYNRDAETFYSGHWMVCCPRLPLVQENINKILFVKSYWGL